MEIMKLFINGLVFGSGWTVASLILGWLYTLYVMPLFINKTVKKLNNFDIKEE